AQRLSSAVMEHRTRSRQNYSSECERKAPELPSFPSDCDYRVFKVLRQVKAEAFIWLQTLLIVLLMLIQPFFQRKPDALIIHLACRQCRFLAHVDRIHRMDLPNRRSWRAGHLSGLAWPNDSRRKIAGP